LAALSAGADVIVVGTGIENDPQLMVSISKQVVNFNLDSVR
jgi:heptaprenylglyceryl phosphate synthase